MDYSCCLEALQRQDAFARYMERPVRVIKIIARESWNRQLSMRDAGGSGRRAGFWRYEWE